jgi:hypothetical protein
MTDFDTDLPAEDPSLPDESRIEIIEATDERLLLHIPGGLATSRLGWAVLAINGIMCFYSTPGVIEHLERRRGALPPPLITLFLSMGWAFAIGLSLYWVRMRFERTTLLVEHGRLVIQRILFGWKRIAELVLGADSRAELVEAYQGKSDPVHRIEIVGTNARVKFGTPLSEREKAWVVERINRFLGTGMAVPTIDHTANLGFTQFPATSAGAMRPLPPILCRSGIRIVESTDSQLHPFIPGGGPQAGLPSRATLMRLMLAAGVTVAAIVLMLDVPPRGGFGASLYGLLFVSWVIALRHLWRWIKLRYPRILLRLEPDRLVVERVLFHRQSTESLHLEPESRARLVESFSDREDWSGRQILQVELRGTDGTVRFGTPLADLEKAWLVDRINDFTEMTVKR